MIIDDVIIEESFRSEYTALIYVSTPVLLSSVVMVRVSCVIRHTANYVRYA